MRVISHSPSRNPGAVTESLFQHKDQFEAVTQGGLEITAFILLLQQFAQAQKVGLVFAEIVQTGFFRRDLVERVQPFHKLFTFLQAQHGGSRCVVSTSFTLEQVAAGTGRKSRSRSTPMAAGSWRGPYICIMRNRV